MVLFDSPWLSAPLGMITSAYFLVYKDRREKNRLKVGPGLRLEYLCYWLFNKASDNHSVQRFLVSNLQFLLRMSANLFMQRYCISLNKLLQTISSTIYYVSVIFMLAAVQFFRW